MKPRITVLTIGINDLEKSMKFYRDGLGFKTQGIVGEEFEYGAVVFFDLGRLRWVFSGSRRAFVGDRMESGMEDR